MDCQKVYEELAFLFADEELDAEQLAAFRRHLERCPECARTTRTTTRFLQILRLRTTRSAAPRSLRVRIAAALTGDTADTR